MAQLVCNQNTRSYADLALPPSRRGYLRQYPALYQRPAEDNTQVGVPPTVFMGDRFSSRYNPLAWPGALAAIAAIRPLGKTATMGGEALWRVRLSPLQRALRFPTPPATASHFHRRAELFTSSTQAKRTTTAVTATYLTRCQAE